MVENFLHGKNLYPIIWRILYYITLLLSPSHGLRQIIRLRYTIVKKLAICYDKIIKITHEKLSQFVPVALAAGTNWNFFLPRCSLIFRWHAVTRGGHSVTVAGWGEADAGSTEVEVMAVKMAVSHTNTLTRLCFLIFFFIFICYYHGLLWLPRGYI